MTPLGLYVHWPFCARICPYCDFNVYRQRGVDVAAWSEALIVDLKYWAAQIERRPLESIYFGGGTPSLAPPSVIAETIDAAERLFGFSSDIEITLEANPNDANENTMEAWSAAGVNRLSLGVQSFDDSALEFLGRDHDAATAKRAVALALDRFPKSTFDLIYALPEQSDDAWRKALDEALGFAPNHLSLYQLTIEPGTAFAAQVAAKRWAPADEDICARHYEIAQAMTAAAGLPAYEVSNHAKPGHQSRHNLIYWRYQDYIGVGPGAHGRLTIDGGRVATKTLDRPDAYLARIKEIGSGVETTEILSDEAQLIERLSMGLRLTEGVALYADDIFYRREDRADRLAGLIEDGYLTLDCGTLRATDTGRPVLNRLIYELIG